MTRFDWVPPGEQFRFDGEMFRKIDFDSAENVFTGSYHRFDSTESVEYNDYEEEMMDIFALDDENLEW